MTTDEIRTSVDDLLPTFTALSDAVWAHPELRWAEHASMDRLVAVAEEHDMTVTRGIGGIPTAFCAEAGTEGPVIAFLGEYDALAGLSQAAGVADPTPDPGNDSGHGHGCGHHLLGAGSLLAAVATARHLRRHGLPGRVRFYGCPAEEAAAGKTFMVRAGVFDDVDAAVTWHPNSATLTRQILTLAYCQASFRFHGVASHAGVSPERGRSALDAVELMNVGVNFLREHMPDQARIHYAITDTGGPSPNVVQADAAAYYVVRAPTVAQMQELYARVVKVARGAAMMTETEVTVEFDGASAEILPNDVLEGLLHEEASTLGGVPFDAADQETARAFTDRCDPAVLRAAQLEVGYAADDPRALHDGIAPFDPARPRLQMTGSTDVGDVSWVTPTVQLLSAVAALGTPGHTWELVAQGTLPAAHKGMAYAATVMARTAARLVEDPVLLARARAEHAARVAEAPYVCPIPDEVVAPPLRG